MPTVLIDGIFRFFFFSNEGNEPIHIHVESDDKYCKFWLNSFQLVRNSGFNGTELTRIRKIIMKNENLIKEKWNEYFSS